MGTWKYITDKNDVEEFLNKKEISDLKVKGYIVKNDDEIIDKMAGIVV